MRIGTLFSALELKAVKRYYGGIFETELQAAQKVNEIILENNLPNRRNII